MLEVTHYPDFAAEPDGSSSHVVSQAFSDTENFARCDRYSDTDEFVPDHNQDAVVLTFRDVQGKLHEIAAPLQSWRVVHGRQIQPHSPGFSIDHRSPRTSIASPEGSSDDALFLDDSSLTHMTLCPSTGRSCDCSLARAFINWRRSSWQAWRDSMQLALGSNHYWIRGHHLQKSWRIWCTWHTCYRRTNDRIEATVAAAPNRLMRRCISDWYHKVGATMMLEREATAMCKRTRLNKLQHSLHKLAEYREAKMRRPQVLLHGLRTEIRDLLRGGSPAK